MGAETRGTKRSAADTIAEEALQGALEEAVLDLEQRISTPLGEPASELLADYGAKWDDFVVSSSSASAQIVTLPLADRDHVGRLIPVKNLHATAAIAVKPSGSDTIDGATVAAAGLSIPAGSCFTYFCQANGKWIEIGRPAAVASGGWVFAPTDVKTAHYSCSAMYELVQVNANGGGFTITLPSIASGDIGKLVCVKRVNMDSTTITIAAASGQSIADSQSMNQSMHSLVYSVLTATQWVIVADYYAGLG